MNNINNLREYSNSLEHQHELEKCIRTKLNDLKINYVNENFKNTLAP